jgi:hypothetical protein
MGETMLKTISQFEVKVGEKVFHLNCQGDSTWGEIHDVLWKMKDFAIQRMREIGEMEKSAQAEAVTDVSE